MRAMAGKIEALGADIRLSTPVQEVCIDAGRVEAVQTAAGRESFDAVISTVPLPYVAPMLPGLPETVRAQYASVENIAVVCVVLKLRQSVHDSCGRLARWEKLLPRGRPAKPLPPSRRGPVLARPPPAPCPP